MRKSSAGYAGQARGAQDLRSSRLLKLYFEYLVKSTCGSIP
jgi:hypothetical protein